MAISSHRRPQAGLGLVAEVAGALPPPFLDNSVILYDEEEELSLTEKLTFEPGPS